MAKIAVIGTGYWGQNLVRNYHQLGALKTVCDINPEALATMAGRFPGIVTTTKYAEVLQDTEIRGVVIALPAVMHFEFAEMALLAGKDVYVEKPLALRLDHAERLIALARDGGRILMVGHLLHYHPAFLKLKEMALAGELGKIQYIYSNRLSLGKIRREENSLWSFAPHDISMILSLTQEMPDEVTAFGGNYLHKSLADVTTTHLSFPGGIKAHIFVSWLHPFKEHKLIVVAEKKMAVFEDSQPWGRKLAIYPHSIKWEQGAPIAEKSEVEFLPVTPSEPLLAECGHFLECIDSREAPLTDGAEGYRVLKVLDQAETSLGIGGHRVQGTAATAAAAVGYKAHETAVIDSPCEIGDGTRIWHFSHVLKGAVIGKGCNLGQNVSVAGGVVIGDNVKIQNNVSLYGGTIVEDDVFLGPSCVLTNVTNPRSQVNRQELYEKTLLQRGATVGANATIVCGVTLGRYSFVAAGAVVASDVPDYALMVGVPARRTGWMSRHGHILRNPDSKGVMTCPESGLRYRLSGVSLRCLDLDEDAPLPPSLRTGKVAYDEFKSREERMPARSRRKAPAKSPSGKALAARRKK